MAGALNFKDVMLAYGKLARAALAHAGGAPSVGFEFAGTVGRRGRTRCQPWPACDAGPWRACARVALSNGKHARQLSFYGRSCEGGCVP